MQNVVPYLQLLGVIIALIGGGIAIQTFRLNARTNKSKFVLDLTETFIKDEEMIKFWYRIDYDDDRSWKFDLTTFRHSEEERRLDTLLYRCSVMGQMLRMGSLKSADLSNVFIIIQRIFLNDQVRNYLLFNMLDFYITAKHREPHWPDAMYLYDELLKWHIRNRNGNINDLREYQTFLKELKMLPHDAELRNSVAHRIKYDRPLA